MNFLKELNNSKYLTEFDDNSALTQSDISSLQSLIRKGAENSGKWSNALELVHKSYAVSSIERPNPDTIAAWKQYETLISYSVEQLSKYHGQNGNWRMTSESFTEKSLYEIGYSSKTKTDICQVEANSVDEIVEFFNHPRSSYTIKQVPLGDSVLLEFWEHGVIKSDIKLEIKEII